jgi:hypothetical protein
MIRIRSFFSTLCVLLGANLANAQTQQGLPANASASANPKGWRCNSGYVERGPACVSVAEATDSEIRKQLIAASLAAYSGSCPCPYNVDRAGRSCGRRSAYSRPGGRSPRCYDSDIPDAEVKQVRDAHKKKGDSTDTITGASPWR